METSAKGEGEIEEVEFEASKIEYESYGGEHHLPHIMNLVYQELSEPYSTFTTFTKVTLQAEVTNEGALALYGRLGFIRAKRLFHYYLNGVDAFRLKFLFLHPELRPSLPIMADKITATGIVTNHRSSLE